MKKFLNIFKIFFVFLLFTIYYLLLPNPTFAQAATPSAASLPATISPTSPLYTDLLVSNLFHSFSCLAVGQSVIGQPCLTYQFSKNTQGMLQGIPVLSQVNTSGGTLGAVTSVIGAMYQNPPVRTVDYLASVGEGLGVVKPAHAQGVVGSGAQVLSPILKLWEVSRNIAYVIMIVIFVVIGVMIMIRNRINPQTVITAQAALPGLVIGLILITFSYFLAGLISDMAFVGTNVVGYYFVAAQNKLSDPAFNDQLNLSQKLSGSSILNILGSMAGIIGFKDTADFVGTVFDALGDNAKSAVHWLVFWLSSQFLSGLIPTTLSVNPWALIAKPILSVLGGFAVTELGISPLLGLLLSFAAALALTYQMIRLFFKLLMAWLTIIFLTISAPFQFLIASLPGRQGIATGWILNILGNILVFPAVVAVVYFAAYLLGPKFTQDCPKDSTGDCLIKVSAVNQIDNRTFISPAYAANGHDIVGTDTFPLFGGIKLDFVKILLAFGALMALPTIPDIIVRTVGRAGQTGQMIGQEIMSGAGFGRGYAQRSYGAGVELGQTTTTGFIGQTQISPSGDLVLSQQGLMRRGVGSIAAGSQVQQGAGKWVMPWRKIKDIK